MAKNGIQISDKQDDSHDIPVPKSSRRIAKQMKKELGSEENLRLLKHIEDLWIESRDAAAENRREQMIDADFYDHIQWTIEDSQVLVERGQAPLVFNIVKQACDWILGTERRTRIDWKVFPRNQEDQEGAKAKTALLKYISDINGLAWERSAQFKDCVLVGVGWLENTVRSDVYDDPLMVKRVDWKQMWWDPYCRNDDLSDCRATHRAKWVDEDYAVAMFPEFADEIRKSSVQFLDSELELFEDWNDLPMVFTNMDRFGRQTQFGRLMGTMSVQRRARKRVRMMETWYKRPVAKKKMWAGSADDDAQSFDGVFYDEENADHVDAIKRGIVSLTDAITEQMWVCIWIKGQMLKNTKSPFKHNKFPMTPCWAFRRHRDGMPYGVIRGQRDPQEDLNKRRSKALMILSSKTVIYEDGAIDQADEDEILDEIARPNAQIRVAKGALEKGKIKIETNTDLAEAHVKMADSDVDQIFQVGGVTRENLGQDTSAASGRAIVAKQQQGAVTTAELYDNLRRSVQASGQITLSNIEQYMPMPKQFRISGSAGQPEFVKVNWPQQNPQTGEWEFTNDITKSEADFIVDEQDFSASYRMQLAQELFELLSNIAQTNPQAAFALLDMAVDMTDLPNKDELVKRIRGLNGQAAPGEQMTPEQQQQRQQQAQQQQQDQQFKEQSQALTLQEMQAKVKKLTAEVTKLIAGADLADAQAGHTAVQTQKAGVETKHAAIMAARDLHAAAPLAPAADALLGAKPVQQLSPKQRLNVPKINTLPGHPNGNPGNTPPVSPVSSGSDIGGGEPPFGVGQP